MSPMLTLVTLSQSGRVHEQRDLMKHVKDHNMDKQYEGLRPQGSVLVAQTEAKVSEMHPEVLLTFQVGELGIFAAN